MRSILIDAGPLIALFDRSDAHHDGVREFIRDLHAQLVTTWPVVTEVSYMLDFDVRAQVDFLRWISSDGLEFFDIDSESLSRIIDLMGKYKDRPMDLADASLVVAAERLSLFEIISIDSDFDIYRTAERKHIRNLYQEGR